MALQTPVVAGQVATAGIPRYSTTQGCRCSIMRTHTPFCIHLEKFQLNFNGQITYYTKGHGNHVHFPGVVLAQSSLSAFEEAGVTESAGESESLTELAPTQVQKNKAPESVFDGNVASPDTSYSSESLNESSNVTTVDSSTADVSILDAAPAQPDVTIPSFSTPTDTVTGAGSQSTEEAVRTATDSLSTEQIKSAKEAYEAIVSGTNNSADQASPMDALSQSSQSLANEISGMKSAIIDGFTRVQESILGSVENVKLSIKSTYDSINGSIASTLKQGIVPDEKPKTVLMPGVDKVADVQERFTESMTSPFRMGTPINNVLKQIVTTVEDLTRRSVMGVNELTANGYMSTKEFLPANIQAYLNDLERKISETYGPVRGVFQQGYTIILDAERAVGINPDNPLVPILLVVGGGLSISLFYQQLRYGGYSGDLAPASALELLKGEGNVLLIDIRSEELREIEGIPDLRRQMRFKAANVAQLKVSNSLQKMLKNTADVEAAITAAAINNLKNVQRNTKIILLDSDGSQSKRIARALKKTGIQMPYRIEGGFKAWEANGLQVKQLGQETPLSFIKEETEAIFDDVKPTPLGLAGITVGVFAGAYALFEWEKTLQLLGLVCICQVVYSRLNSYESAEDAKSDLKLLLRPFTLATQAIIWVAGALEPSKLRLATSPSTSAVQDRVLQAAAKHGPMPSEASQDLEEAVVEADEAEPKSDGDPTREG